MLIFSYFAGKSYEMIYSDSLVALIQTLTSKEKTAFKLYVTFNSGSRTPYYEKLYNIYNDLISKNLKEEEYQNSVSKALQKQTKLKNDLGNIRKRLKEKLLESLLLTNKTIESETSQAVNVIKILIKRKIFSEAESKLKLVKKKALRYDLNKQLIEILDLELELLELLGNSKRKTIKIKLEDLICMQGHYMELYQKELKLKNIFKRLVSIAQKDIHFKKKESRQELSDLIDNPELIEFPIEKYKEQNNIHILFWYYRIINLHASAIGKFELAFDSGKKLVAYIESDDSISKSFEDEYVKSLCSFSRACYNLKKLDELGNIIEKVKLIYKTKKNYNALEATCDMGLLYYLNNGQFDKAYEISEIMDDSWNDLSAKIIDGKLLWYAHSNAVLYWIAGKNEKFEYWNSRGQNIARSKAGREFYFGLRILELTFEYDNNEMRIFKEKIEALQKTMQNNENLKEFEVIVLKHFKTFYHIHNSQKLQHLSKLDKSQHIQNNFQSLKDSLLELKFKKLPINYSEIKLWCDSHLMSKSILQIFNKRFAAQKEIEYKNPHKIH